MDMFESFMVKFQFIQLGDSLLDLVFEIGVFYFVTTGLKFKFLKIVIVDTVKKGSFLGLIIFFLCSF